MSKELKPSDWAPERIYLQREQGEGGSHTWCEDSVGDGDIIEEAEYVRVGAQDVARAPEGWKLVPVEPTPTMRKAAADAWLDCDSKLILNKAMAAARAAIKAGPDAKEGS